MVCLALCSGVVSAEETADLQISTGTEYSLKGTVTVKRGGKPAPGVRIRLDFSSARNYDEFFTGADGSTVVSINAAHALAFLYLDSKNVIRYVLHGDGLPFPLLIELPEFEVRKEAMLPTEVSFIDHRNFRMPSSEPRLEAEASWGWRYETKLVGTVKIPSHEGMKSIWIDLDNPTISIHNIAPFKHLRLQFNRQKKMPGI